MASYFEITISSRQLALAVVGVVALILVAFGLGVTVGVQEPAPTRPESTGMVAVAPGPTFVPSAFEFSPEPTSGVVDQLRGEATAAAVAATPVGPEMLPAQPPPPTEVPPTPRPTAEATPLPTREAAAPTATEFPLPRLGRGVWVQVGALTVESGAQNLRRRVLQLGYTPNQVVVQVGNDGKYRVRVGPFPDDESAGRVVARLRADGFPGAFTVKE